MNKNSTQPVTVTILAVFVLSITAWNAIRAYGALVNWQVLIEFGANPIYILVDGIFWALGGLWLFRVLWEGHHHGIRFGIAGASIYFLRYWFDRLFFQPAPAPNTIFSLIISTILLLIFCITLELPNSKAFFNKE